MEFVLTEWHIDPVYIAENWTDEMLRLMIDKLVQRRKGVNEPRERLNIPSNDQMVSDTELFRSLGGKMKVVKG